MTGQGILILNFQNCTTLQHKIVQSSSNSNSTIHVQMLECWTHKRKEHDFFISYRVGSEGIKCGLSNVQMHNEFSIGLLFIFSIQEPSNGIVQLIYSGLAVKRTSFGNPIFVFLDKHCLNYGQNWEAGFLHGLKFAKVIILLMSNKVWCLFVESVSN